MVVSSSFGGMVQPQDGEDERGIAILAGWERGTDRGQSRGRYIWGQEHGYLGSLPLLLRHVWGLEDKVLLLSCTKGLFFLFSNKI